MNQRREFVLRAMGTLNFRELCAEFGISPKTGYKWQERFLRYGLEGMEELSRKPKRHANELKESVVCAIVRIQQRRRTWGPRKVRQVYLRRHGTAPSESSFKRVLDRAGFVRERRIRSREEAGRIFTGRRAKAPNEIWTVDFKGWWRNPAGERVEPLTVRDEFSRYVLELRAVADGRTETVRACFERLFARHGLPAAIRSDNGPPFASLQAVLGLSRLSAWWVVLGIDLERGRPGCPQDNGAHERLHLDIERDLRGLPTADQQASFEVWRQTFNEERPHEALEMRYPAEVYRDGQRPYAGTPDDLVYAGMESRRVRPSGHLSWAGESVFISTALMGWSVGLKPCGPGQYGVYFGRLLLGQLEEQTLSFQPMKTVAQEQAAGAGPSPTPPPSAAPQTGPRRTT